MDYAARAEQLADQVDTEFADLSDSQALELAAIYAQLAVAQQARRIADALGAAHEPQQAADGRYRLNTDLEGM
ncbi:hypothetical protein ABZ799_01455 [Nocardiopsis dassonvillei]|uniref:hypothetical protein n=1 Tax=Nocardiopsis dassonvillei TaxID=2014 RepID=UPI0033E1CF7A